MLFGTCRYCGSRNIRIIGGDYGDPFDRKPEQHICQDCGRLLWSEPAEPEIPMPELSAFTPHTTSIQRVIVVEMTAQALNVRRTASMTFPYQDGTHSFSGGEYPFIRFSGFQQQGDLVTFDGEEHRLTREGIYITRMFTATDYCGAAWPETVNITIRDTFQTIKSEE